MLHFFKCLLSHLHSKLFFFSLQKLESSFHPDNEVPHHYTHTQNYVFLKFTSSLKLFSVKLETGSIPSRQSCHRQSFRWQQHLQSPDLWKFHIFQVESIVVNRATHIHSHWQGTPNNSLTSIGTSCSSLPQNNNESWQNLSRAFILSTYLIAPCTRFQKTSSHVKLRHCLFFNWLTGDWVSWEIQTAEVTSTRGSTVDCFVDK